MTRTTVSAARLDLAGALVAGACAVHCALLPLLFGSLGAWGIGWFASEATGRIVLGVSLVFVTISLIPAFRRHRQRLPLLLVALAVPAFLLAEAATMPRTQTAVWSAIGGGLIAVAHLRNRRLVARL